MSDKDSLHAYALLDAMLGTGPATRAESEALRRMIIRVPAGQTIAFESQPTRKAYMLLSGWACSVRHLMNGCDQIFDIRLPGDLVGLSNLMLSAAPSAIEAITPVELYPFSRHNLLAADEINTSLRERLLFSMARDHAVLMEHLIGVARRKPQVRTAHFLLELSERVTRAGLGERHRFVCPLSQYVLADVLGMTAVHLNRTLRSLREMDLVSFRHATVVIIDRPAMIRFAEFNPAYLDHDPAQRLLRPIDDLRHTSVGPHYAGPPRPQ